MPRTLVSAFGYGLPFAFALAFSGAALAQEGTQPAEPPTAPATEAPADPPKTETPVEAPDAPKPVETPAEKREPANEVKPVESAGGSEVTHDAQDKRAQCPKNMLLCWQIGNAAASVAVWPKLRVRPGFEYVDADPQIAYIGDNDGFILDSARLGIEGNVSDLMRFRLTFDTQRLPEDAPNQAVVPIVAAPRDAYVAWTPSRWFMLQVGQQNVPSDYEGGDVDADIPFTRRSVMARGVRAGHGNAVDGLSPDRQIGVVIGSTNDAKLGDIPLEYRLGIANGNGINTFGNDNGLPALYLRLGSGFGDLVRFGFGGRFNPRTVGTLPNLYTESDAVGFADVALTVAGVEFVATAVGRQTALTTFIPDPSNPAGQESGWGAATWLGYTFGLGELLGAKIDAKPAVRFSFYDPSSAFATDQLMETTIGVRLDGDRRVLPLSFFLDYVFLNELGDIGNNVPVRDLANNRLTALFQIEL